MKYVLNKSTCRDYQNLTDILKTGFLHYPEKTALIFGSKKIAYGELYKKAGNVAFALKRWGIKKGDRVALLLDNSPEFVTCYFGILLTAAVVVPINHMFKRDEIRYILEDSGSSCLITSATYTKVSQELNVMMQSLKTVIYTNQKIENSQSLTECLNGSNDLPPYDVQAEEMGRDTLAVFLYTSGTTGHPKAAMLTHGNLLSNALASMQIIDVTSKDTCVCFLPLFHSFAATVCMLMPLANGARIVLLKSPRPIKKLLRAIRKNRVTLFVGIPSIYQILSEMKLPRFLPPRLLRLFNPLRLAISGAAALPAPVLMKFEQKFKLPLLEGYGLTEASPVVSLNPLRGKRKPGSIGLPLPGVDVKIIDDNGKELGVEEIGELCVRGPNVMRGYYKKDEENLDVLKDNWLLTGDMAKIDNEGYLYIMGRKKEMVNVRGLNVYPREIEEVLYQNPKIKEAAVIGIPDAHKGEVPKGFVVLKEKDSMTEHEIISFLKERLALYKIPKRIEIRGELPKNSSGKILKRVLAQEVRG